jgi:hypothetical protein
MLAVYAAEKRPVFRVLRIVRSSVHDASRSCGVDGISVVSNRFGKIVNNKRRTGFGRTIRP